MKKLKVFSVTCLILSLFVVRAVMSGDSSVATPVVAPTACPNMEPPPMPPPPQGQSGNGTSVPSMPLNFNSQWKPPMPGGMMPQMPFAPNMTPPPIPEGSSMSFPAPNMTPPPVPEGIPMPLTTPDMTLPPPPPPPPAPDMTPPAIEITPVATAAGN